MTDLYWTTVSTFERREMYTAEARAAREPAAAQAPAAVREGAPVRTTREWRRLEQAILRALEPFEEAYEAVGRALAEMEPLAEGVP